MKKILIFFSVIILSFVNLAKANEIKILYKLENEIITNQDVIDELNYLISLNNNLTSLEKNKLKEIAISSVIKEKIKYLELKKYFKINENTKEVDNIVLKELNNRLRINELENLKKHFSLLFFKNDIAILKSFLLMIIAIPMPQLNTLNLSLMAIKLSLKIS